MSRKAEQSARTKAALIEAAIELFGERGYRGSSLKAIAARARTTHGVIPFHFGSKEGLLLAVVETCFARFFDEVLSELSLRERDYGLGDLAAIMESQLRFQDAHPEVGRVFQVLMAESIAASPELRPHFRAFHERVCRIAREWVCEGQARGVLRDDLDPAATVDALLAFLTGLRLHDLLAGIERRPVHRQMLSILERGVLERTDRREGER